MGLYSPCRIGGVAHCVRGALLLWALALPAGTQAQSNPDFELAENGVTVLCDDAEVGDTGEVNGTVYTKRTRSQINDQNAATTCTSGITNLGTLFRFNDSFNEDISTWDVSSATSLNSLFLRAESFNQDLSNWDVSNVTNMRGMFDGAESFDQDLSSWDTGNVEDMRNMFRDAESFDQDLSNWDVSGVVEDGGSFDNTMEGMFDGSGLSNNNYDALLIGWAQLDLQDDITLGASGIQYGPDAVEARQSIIDDYNWTINDGGFTGINFELASNDVTVLCEDADAGDVGEVEGVLYTKRNVEDIDTDNAATTCTSGITDMSELFEGETTFNEDISTWDVSNVTNMSFMFRDAEAFNQDISFWDVSSVENMRSMFNGAETFEQDIGAWETENVTDMRFMFSGAESFNQDIGEWETQNVTRMDRMFRDAESFNQDISDWETQNVTTMNRMFLRAASFDQDIGNWDVSNVENMRRMFRGAVAFDQDLSHWDVGQSSNMSEMFENTALSTVNYDRILIGWAGRSLNDDVELGTPDIEFCNSEPFRDHLVEEYNWTIEDAGQADNCPTTLVGDGFAEVDSDGGVDLGTTDVRVDFDGVVGSGRVTAARFDDMAENIEGIDEAQVSPYRLVIVAGDGLAFDNSTEARFDVNAFGGIADPDDVTVYSRPLPGTGEFEDLPTSFDSDENEIVVNTPAFSEVVLASDDNPLPVELSSFEATLDGDDALLQWETASETNNAEFEVQRAKGSTADASADMSWETVTTLDGAGTTDEPQSYRFTDTALPYASDSLSYRLRQIDTDGTESFSDAVVIARQVTEAELLPTYPNPVRGQATVRFAVPEQQVVQLALYDVLGRRVQLVADGPADGRTEQVLDVSGLSSGTYFLRMQTDGHTETQRVTVVR